MRFLTAELMKVVNADTGEPLIKDIVVTRREYSGEYLEKLPDLLVTWNRNAPISAWLT